MHRRMRRLPSVVIAALMAVSALPLLPAAARSAAWTPPEPFRWVEPASDPDAVMGSILLHDYKIPAEFEDRLKYAGKDGTLQVMVSLTSRDSEIERAMTENTTWLEWYGNAPRFLGRVTPDQLKRLLDSPYTVFVEPDYPITNFMSASTLDVKARSAAGAGTGVWSFDPSAGTLGQLRSEVPGLDVSQVTGRGVTVAITDSGIDSTHQDFGGWDCERLPYQPCESRIVADIKIDHLVDTGADGVLPLPTSELASGHGTHVAGTVAGNGYYTRDGGPDAPRYGGDGYVFGIAPEANLISTKNGDTLWAGLSNFGLQWQADNAAEYGIRVSSNSWGCIGGCSFNGNSALAQTFRDLYNNGVLVTFAVGNDGGGTNGASFSGNAQSPYVLGVASYDHRNLQLASTSSRGEGTTTLANPSTWTPESEPVNGVRRPDLAAPGVGIWSARTLTGGAASLVPRVYTGDATGGSGGGTVPYASMGGTSMATPHVAGAGAILAGACPGAHTLDIMRALKAGANRTKVLKTGGSALAEPFEAGYGGLDVRASLDWLLGQPSCGGDGTTDPDPDPTPSPTPTPTPSGDPEPGAETRYYFHSVTTAGNADLAVAGNTFDAVQSEWTDDAHWADVPGVGNGAPAALYDPNWAGQIDGAIRSFTADFWQRAPIGDASGEANYDITIWVGSGTTATRYDLPQLDSEVEGLGPDPQRVTHTFTTMHACASAAARCSRGTGLTPEVPLDIDPGDQPVTISIAGRYTDSQAGAVIVYDSVTHPSGFVIGTSGGGGTDPTPTPTPTSDPTPTPTPTSTPTEGPPTDPAACTSYSSEPNDEYFRTDLFGLDGGQWGLRRIQATEAWSEATGCGTTVAVLDSGLDLRWNEPPNPAEGVHPDLACDGKVKIVADSDRVANDSDPHDGNGHGTHVAGIVGACTDNQVGVAGVAPDASVMPIRVLDDAGSGTAGQLAEGIRLATQQGAHVINMSLGWPSALSPVEEVAGPLFPDVEQAIEEARAAGVVLVAAAGNEYQFPLCSIPAISEDVICVGASDPRDLNASYSNFPMKLDDNETFGPGLLAPGGTGSVFCDLDAEDVISTYLRHEDTCGPRGYQAIAGSSMASPHVAGVAALAYELLGNDRNAANGRAVIDAIIGNTDDLYAPGFDPMSGYGRVNALKVVQALGSGDPDPNEPQQTEVSFTEDSAQRGQYTDTAIVEAALVDEEGEPIQGGAISFKLQGEDGETELLAVTDEFGLARGEFSLVGKPDDYELLADYEGEEDRYLASSAGTTFTIGREETTLDVNVEGNGNGRSVYASLTDHDTPMRGVEGVTLLFFVDGEQFGEAVTDGAGMASVPVPPDKRGKGRAWDWEVVFEGSDYWQANSRVTQQ